MGDLDRRDLAVVDDAWRAFAEPHRRDITIDGRTLHCIDAGTGEAVLLVHGYGDSIFTWHRTAPALTAAGLRVVAVDQPGLGRSFRPEPTYRFTVENQAAWTLAVLNALEIDRCAIVGHSMGGAIALWLCFSATARISRAALLAPVSYRPWRRTMAVPGLHRLARRLAGSWLLRRVLESLVSDRKVVTPELLAEYRVAARRPDYFATLASLARDFFSTGFERTCAGFGDIATPFLVLWGQQDPWLPVRRGRALAARLPHARLVTLPRCGHLPHVEHPDVVNRELSAFLGTSAASEA